jgi:hypothetical protein
VNEGGVEMTGTDIDENTWVELPDTIGTSRFRGELLAEVSTQTGRTLRWTTMQLFKITGGEHQGQYVVSITGHTTVYHTVGSSCNSGVPTLLVDLPDEDLVPCHLCMKDERVIYLVDHPDDSDPDNFMETWAVNMEKKWYHVARCTDPQQVVVELRKRRGKAPTTGEMSRPAVRLLQLAALKDQAFDPRNMVNEL